MDYALPVLFALFVWWFGTGLILYLDGLPQRTFRWSLAGGAILAAIALYGVWATAGATSPAAICAAFAFAIVIWGWHELSFLLGEVTGPRKTPCPEGARGWARFRYACEAVIHHELALFATVLAIALLTWEAANQTALATFLVLWVMRLSAKLNIFFGVPNHTEEFLPAQLGYITTYFKRARMNYFFPVSVTAASVVLWLLIEHAAAPDTAPHMVQMLSLVSALLALAVLEHWLLVLPVSASAAWGAILKATGRQPAPHRFAVGHPASTAPQGAAPRSGANLQSWASDLAAECDPEVLRDVLGALSKGTYGEVELVFGVAKAGPGWVHFNIEQGHSSLSAFRPRGHEQPCVVAIGRKLDRARLHAAFGACAIPATGGVSS
jgi:putative photosynthetic complex assembly protein 2